MCKITLQTTYHLTKYRHFAIQSLIKRSEVYQKYVKGGQEHYALSATTETDLI